MELINLPNLGNKLIEKLNEAGVYNVEEFDKKTTEELFLRIMDNDSTACYSTLCALSGAAKRIRWHNLAKEEKEQLKKFFDEVKSNCFVNKK